MNQTTKEYREKIAEFFVKSLEEEQLDWKKNWKGMNRLPENAVTGKKYKGINSFWLSFRSMQIGSEDPRWATFKQIQDAGWKLNKGSKGEKIEYWQPYDFEKRAKISWADYRIRAAEGQVGLIAKYYTVFNAKDIVGIPDRISCHNQKVNADELVTRLSRNMNVKIINDGGDRAFYRPSEDKIHLPEPDEFFSTYDYNATVLHELSHATGASHRLGRNLTGTFGSPGYAYEELVAEISSCFMSEYLSTGQSAQHIENHKAYVQSWIKSIREKPETLIRAIRDAGNVANYMEYQAELIDEKEYLLLRKDSFQVDENKTVAEETFMEHRVPNNKFLSQIDRFYSGKMHSNEIIQVGKTPQYLEALGVKELPILLKQKTLNKCIREAKGSKSAHNLSRDLIEQMPNHLEKPVFVVNEMERNSYALISDTVDQDGKPMLLAVKLDCNIHGMEVHEISSYYGRSNINDYLLKKNEVFICDMKRAKNLSRILRLQLPTAWKVLDYNNNVSRMDLNVNKKFSEQADICKDLKQYGFIPDSSLVKKIHDLEQKKGFPQSLKDICNEFKQDCRNSLPEEKELINSIAKECQAQELNKVLLEPGQ